MPRKLKVYRTSLGFYDLAIAAPSMKAALKAWGASGSPELFRQGFAWKSKDKEVVAAAMAKPGMLLRRPVGSDKRFQEHPELPSAESLAKYSRRSEPARKKTGAPKSKEHDKQVERGTDAETAPEAVAKADGKAARKAAAAFEKEERRREAKRRKDEAAAGKRAQRLAAMEKAKAALDAARREHDRRVGAIEKQRLEVERRAEDEETRWRKERSRLETALQKASR